MQETYALHQVIQIIMAIVTFAVGCATLGAGLFYILSRDIRSAVNQTTAHGANVRRKALLDVNLAPSLESASQFVDAINRLIGTAAGVGVFLTIAGGVLCIAAYLMLEHLQ